MSTAELEREAEEDEERDEVTVLIKNPQRDWENPVEVYEEREEAEERQAQLGIDLDLRDIARLVDAPLIESD